MSSPDAVRQTYAEKIAAASASLFANETELRQRLYVEFFPYLTEYVGMDESHLRHEGTGSSGRFDSLFGRMLVEYKAPSELSTAHKRNVHAGQALRYVEDGDFGADVVVITDGLTWGILRDRVGPGPGEQGWLDLGEAIPEKPIERFQWSQNSPETIWRIMDLIESLRTSPVTTASLVSHLGPRRHQTATLLGELAAALESREPDSRTDILFRQWVQLAGVSYGISDEGSEWPKPRAEVLGELAETLPSTDYAASIFILHTYMALCSKLIAAETLALSHAKQALRPTQWVSLNKEKFAAAWDGLESGAVAEQLRAEGLMGGDLFGWYAPLVASNEDLERALRSSLSVFSELAWARLAHASTVTGDLLRGFYAAVVPRQMRKGLGEFFTPSWIADRMLQQSLALMKAPEDKRLKILDPSCGSGTFLVAAFVRALRAARLRGLDAASQAHEAIDSVYGFDINPVSPIMSRVNLLLAMGDRVSEVGNFSFRVYQADSILIPEQITGELALDEMDSDMRIPLVIGDVKLPSCMATIEAIDILTSVISHSISRNRTPEVFAARIEAALTELNLSESDLADSLSASARLYEKLLDLHKQGKNGIWAHVLQQSFAPRVLPEMDLVIGNPPWISWKHLPEAWRKRSEPVWRQWGLWQRKSAGQGTPMSDISTLLLARSIATYSPNGHVSLLVPEGILVNEPGGRPIRKSKLTSDAGAFHDGTAEVQHFRTLHVDNFGTLKPFADAANTPIAIYMQSGEEAEFPFTMSDWTRAEKRSRLSDTAGWKTASASLVEQQSKVSPIDPTDPASRWRPHAVGAEIPIRKTNDIPSYTWGQGFHTRGADGIFVCEILSASPFRNGLVRIKTRPDIGRSTSHLESVEVEVEAEFLWPLLRGQNVHPFYAESSELFIIVPHDPEKLSRVMTQKELIARAPNLFDYLEPHIPYLMARKAYDLDITKSRPWGIQGAAWAHLRSDSHLVAMRYMHAKKTPPAVVLAPEHRAKLGRSTTVYTNNKVNFTVCSSLEEADYLAAFMNSKPAQETIARQVSSTTIGPATLGGLAVPKYDSKDSVHENIRAIGAAARADRTYWTDSVSITLTDLVATAVDSAEDPSSATAGEQLTV